MIIKKILHCFLNYLISRLVVIGGLLFSGYNFLFIFNAPMNEPLRQFALFFFAACVILTMVFYFHSFQIPFVFRGKKIVFRWSMLTLLLLNIVVLSWHIHIKPSNDHPWSTPVSRLPYADLSSLPKILISDVRDFRWTGEKTFYAKWVTREFDLDQIEGVDWIVSHWAGDLIAHTMLAFRFKNTEPLVVNVKTRLMEGVEQSMLAGLFRQVNLIWVLTTENDAVRTRVEHRNEDIYLYPLLTNKSQLRIIFLRVCERVNQLYNTPEFYHPIFNNCTSELIHLTVNDFSDIRLFLNGYFDQYVFEKKGFSDIAPKDTFIRYRAKHLINLKLGNQPVSDRDFSRIIRAPLLLDNIE